MKNLISCLVVLLLISGILVDCWRLSTARNSRHSTFHHQQTSSGDKENENIANLKAKGFFSRLTTKNNAMKVEKLPGSGNDLERKDSGNVPNPPSVPASKNRIEDSNNKPKENEGKFRNSKPPKRRPSSYERGKVENYRGSEKSAVETKVDPKLILSASDNEDLQQPEDPNSFKSGFVSILGNPNVGKSTLLNAILGQKLSIVSPKPQTTRHRILGVLSEKDYQVVFSDTPGMLEPVYALQETMRDAARGAVGDADVHLLVTDVYGEDLHDQQIMEKLRAINERIVVVINKADLLERVKVGSTGTVSGGGAGKSVTNSTVKSIEELTQIWRERLPAAELVVISAASNVGVPDLLAKITSSLQPGPRYFPEDSVTDRNERFFVTEIIRETLFEQFQDEIPYSAEVTIDSFKDKSASLSVIEAGIVVSRTSQKIIVIGKGGAKLKELGTKAREKLEKVSRVAINNMSVILGCVFH